MIAWTRFSRRLWLWRYELEERRNLDALEHRYMRSAGCWIGLAMLSMVGP